MTATQVALAGFAFLGVVFGAVLAHLFVIPTVSRHTFLPTFKVVSVPKREPIKLLWTEIAAENGERPWYGAVCGELETSVHRDDDANSWVVHVWNRLGDPRSKGGKWSVKISSNLPSQHDAQVCAELLINMMIKRGVQ